MLLEQFKTVHISSLAKRTITEQMLSFYSDSIGAKSSIELELLMKNSPDGTGVFFGW